jgi:hypothetical protein
MEPILLAVTNMANWTIQLLIDCDIVVSARCGEGSCDNQHELNLLRIKAKLGPEASAMHNDLARKMRCSKCGNEKIRLSYSPRDQQTGGSRIAPRYDPLAVFRPAVFQ